jgi:NADH-quinone oxidoreductase subunit N
MTEGVLLAAESPVVDYMALFPEIVLAAVVCLVLIVDLVLPDDRKWIAMPISLGGILATLMAVLYIASGPVRETLGGMFVVDDFALVFKVIFLLAGILVLLISHDYLRGDDIHKGEYYFLVLCSLLGMLVIASSRDLIAIFVALELVTLPTFVLAGIRKADLKSNEAALKFFLFGILSAAVMLFGMSLIYGLTGTTNLLDIAAVLRNIDVGTEVAFLGIFFLVVGFGFKVSAFPFQWWVPDTYEGAPVPVAAFLSVASKTAGFVGLLQIMFLAFGDLADIWRPFFAVIAVLTMTFGNLVALQQKHIVRLLAYSSIGQAGYILLPLGVVGLGGVAVDKQAFTAAIVYLLIYAFMETGAFAVAVAHGRSEGGGYQVSDYSGLFSRSPMLAVSMAVFLFSLAGVPPFAGWAAKFFVFSAVISAGSLWLAAIMAINTVIALFYYAAVARYMFFETGPTSDRPLEIPTLPRLAITTAALAVVIGGILPDIFGSLASVSTLL